MLPLPPQASRQFQADLRSSALWVPRAATSLPAPQVFSLLPPPVGDLGGTGPAFQNAHCLAQAGAHCGLWYFMSGTHM